MRRPPSALLIVALVGALLAAVPAVDADRAGAAVPPPPRDLTFDPEILDPEPLIGGGVEGFTTSSVPSQLWRVHAFAQVGDRIFVGGAFTTVSERPWAVSPTHAQPYLAAFDLETNDWISSFTPVLDDVVWDLAVHDEKLIVGGEFDTVNGVARQGLVALDPETGEIDAGFVASIDNAGTSYEGSVRALEVVGDDLYVVGDFNRLVEPPWAHGVYRAARVDAATGDYDPDWYPRPAGGGVFDIAVDAGRGKALVVGAFTSMNASPSTLSGAVVDLSTGATVADHPMSTNGAWDQTYGAAVTADRYWLGGEQHFLQVRSAADWSYLGCHGGGNWAGPTCEDHPGTPAPTGSGTGGGDFQVVEELDGHVVAGGHIQWHWWSSFADGWTLMSDLGGTRVMRADGSQVDFLAGLPYWTQGPYAAFADTNGCLYLGGDYTGNVDGFGRMCPVLEPRDLTAVDGPAPGLTWLEPAVAGAGVDHYEVWRDGALLTTVDTPGHSDDTASEGQTHSYTVVAVTGSGVRGLESAAVSATATAAQDPVVDPVADRSDPVGDQIVPLQLAGSDPDGGAVTYIADQLPAGLTLETDTGEITGTPTALGTVFVEITVTDDEGDTATTGFEWDVFDPDEGLPPFGTPAGVVLTSNGVDTVTVEWEGVAGAAGYLVHRDWQFQAFVTAGTVYVDAQGIEAGSTYRYQIRAQDEEGTNSAPTPVEQITVGGADVTPPSVPADVVLTTNGVDRVEVTWSASTDDVGVTGYLVHRDWQYLAYVSAGTMLVDNSVAGSTTYRYQVRAQDGAGNNSGPSTLQSITVELEGEPDTEAPSTPPGAAAGLDGDGTAVEVTWSPATDNVGVTGYLVHRDWQYLAFRPSGVTAYVDPSVEAGQRYRYQVRAQDAAGNNSVPTDLLVVDVP